MGREVGLSCSAALNRSSVARYDITYLAGKPPPSAASRLNPLTKLRLVGVLKSYRLHNKSGNNKCYYLIYGTPKGI